MLGSEGGRSFFLALAFGPQYSWKVWEGPSCDEEADSVGHTL